jgi:hypothetical protein
LTEIFKTYAECNPMDLEHGAVVLCLVEKYWNAVATATPQLWDNISFSSSFTPGHLARMLRRVQTSKPHKIDIFIDLRHPDEDHPEFNEHKAHRHRAKQSIWVRDIMVVLEGTEEHWRSIKVVSNIWVPLYGLMGHWTFTHLPSLESISMERANRMFGMRDVPFDPQGLIEPMTLFGPSASVPNLRELSMSAVHVDWDDASVCFQNLRKLEINNQTHDAGPSFEEFAEILSSSPRLEYLDVSGFCPEHHTDPRAGRAPGPGGLFVHLPALKDFIFGWKQVDRGRLFLQMFQIGGSLERLTLMDTESGLGNWADGRHWNGESQTIFEALYELGSAAPKNEEDMPSKPFISMRGVKRLEVAWTEATRFSLNPFLETLTAVEDIWLEDVDENVLESVTRVRAAVGRVTVSRPLRLDLRWTWDGEVPDFAGPFILQMKDLGAEVTVRVSEE